MIGKARWRWPNNGAPFGASLRNLETPRSYERKIYTEETRSFSLAILVDRINSTSFLLRLLLFLNADEERRTVG